jgi:hypothetical protein
MEIPLELTTAPLWSVQKLVVNVEEEVVKVPEDSTSTSVAVTVLPETSSVAPLFTKMPPLLTLKLEFSWTLPDAISKLPIIELALGKKTVEGVPVVLPCIRMGSK